MTYRLFDAKRGNELSLGEFPSLFTMEAHTGFCGIIFGICWFLAASIYVPNFWTNGGLPLDFFVGALALSFIVLAWVSTALANYFRNGLTEIDEQRRQAKDDAGALQRLDEGEAALGVQARIGITLLSAGYIATCCGLIWLTDGALSPFAPFYIMIFTLTIGKCKVSPPGPGVIVLLAFLISIAFACYGAWYWGSFIAKSDLALIENSGFQYFMHALFIAFSLIVPTVSSWLVENKKRKNSVGPAPSAGHNIVTQQG